MDFPPMRQNRLPQNGRGESMGVHPDAADEAIDDYREERKADRIEARVQRIVIGLSVVLLAWGVFAVADAIKALSGIVQSKELKWQAPSPALPTTSPPTQDR